MRETIDLYAKLVIGTFSFIGPSFTLFISLFYQALERSTVKHKNQLTTLISLNVDNKQFSELIKNNQKELNLLDPKRQVRRLFIGLFASLLFIFFYYFQSSHFWPYKFQSLRIVSILISQICFVYCLLVLWQVFCTIISTKSDLEKDILIQKNPNLKTINNDE